MTPWLRQGARPQCKRLTHAHGDSRWCKRRTPKPELLRTLLATFITAGSPESARRSGSPGAKAVAKRVLDADVAAYYEPRHVIDMLTEFQHARPALPEVRRLGSAQGRDCG